MFWVSYMRVFCICPCSAQLSMFHLVGHSRNMPIIIIIIIIVIILCPQAAEGVIKPTMLSARNVQFWLQNEPQKGGRVNGSNVTLQTGAKAFVSTELSTSKRQCTILFNSIGLEQLQLTVR